ncbi:MAG: hypothetical protein FJ293_09620 [Planctomycetes bacterium]|nr:hypothetical protein [Planctomycetota bacterium]
MTEPVAEPRVEPLRRDPLAGPLKLLALLALVLFLAVEAGDFVAPARDEIDRRVQDVTANLLAVDVAESAAVVFLLDTWSGWPRAHGDLMAQALLGTCPADVAVARVDLGETITDRSVENALSALLEFAQREPTLPIVVNMSFGGGRASAVERDRFRALAAAGVVLVAAAGNEGSDAPFFPAALPEVLAVGNVHRLGRVKSSNFGDWVDCYLDGYFTTTVRELPSATPGERLLHTSIETGTSFSAARLSGLMASVVAGRRLAPAAALQELLAAAGCERGETISAWKVRWKRDRGWRHQLLALAAGGVALLLIARWIARGQPRPPDPALPASGAPNPAAAAARLP